MLTESGDDHSWSLDGYSETEDTEADNDFTLNVRHLLLKVYGVYIIKTFYNAQEIEPLHSSNSETNMKNQNY